MNKLQVLNEIKFCLGLLIRKKQTKRKTKLKKKIKDNH